MTFLHELSELYDQNKYQDGLAKCKKGLTKHPDNPEIIGWKAIFLFMNGQKAEGLELMATTLRSNMTNAKVWKLNGVLMKEKGDYIKALQSYTQAHRMDGSDDEVLGELVKLHLYERNLSQFAELATKLLTRKITMGTMIRYVLAMFMTGRFDTCLKLLNQLESSVSLTPDDESFNNELRLFHGKVLLELKRWNEYVEYLTGPSRIKFTDKVTVKEFLVRCYIELNQKEKALDVINELLSEYPENGDYFEFVEKLLPIDGYIEYLLKVTGSNYAKVRALELMDVNDTRFEALLSSFMTPLLMKGAPFLFVNLKELSGPKLDISIKIASSTDVPVVYQPIVKLFIACVMYSRKNYTNALELIEEGLKHTPTITELTVMKIKILRKLGMADEAAETAKQLAEMDPSDRNSITIYTSALLKDGKFKTAFEVAEPFSIFQDKKPRLLSTQYNDWHLKCGDCCYNAGRLDTALKLYQDVVRHFEEYRRCQYNFIAWKIRCISAIFDMLQWADELPQHPILGRALTSILKIGFAKQDKAIMEQAALKATKSNDEAALAYTCAYFANNGEPIGALKCYKKIKGSWKLACVNVMERLFASGLDKLPAVIREVAVEEYEPFSRSPASFEDHMAVARGYLFIGDLDKAGSSLQRAIEDYPFSYRQAQDIYQFACNEIGRSELASHVVELIMKKYPRYQLHIEFEEAPLPKELDYE